MELFIFFGFLALFIFVFAKAFVPDANSQSPEIDQGLSTKSELGEKSETLEPFDSYSASEIEIPVIIEGPAYIIDGDSIVIQKTQIRLFGIDAPELEHPHGRNAKWALVKLSKGNQIAAHVSEVDDYGRTVARCYVPDGRDLSAEMVKLGLAIDWPKFSGGEYSSLEIENVRKKLWLADARQKGRMHVWEKFEANQRT